MARQRTGLMVIAGILLAAAAMAAVVVRVMLSFEKEHRASVELPAATGEVTPEQLAGLVDRGDNAVWVSKSWWFRPHPTGEIRSFAAALEARGIHRAYLQTDPEALVTTYCTPRPAEQWPFLAEARRLAPGLELLLAFEIPQGTTLGQDDPACLAAVAREGVRAGAVGVQLPPGASDQPALLQALRSGSGTGLLSRVIAPTMEDGGALHGLSCGGAHEVVLWAFDTGLSEAARYPHLVEQWTAALARTLGTADAGQCHWRIALSADPRRTPAHDPQIESLERGLLAVRGTFAQRQVPQDFRGVALWGEWAMGTSEWALFDAAWRGARRVTLPPPEGPLADGGTP